MVSDYVRKLVENDIGAAKDNLYRAKTAVRGGANPSIEWGSSGETLQQIIDGYQAWLDKANAELAATKSKE